MSSYHTLASAGILCDSFGCAVAECMQPCGETAPGECPGGCGRGGEGEEVRRL